MIRQVPRVQKSLVVRQSLECLCLVFYVLQYGAIPAWNVMGPASQQECSRLLTTALLLDQPYAIVTPWGLS